MVTDKEIDQLVWQLSGGAKGYDEDARATIKKWIADAVSSEEERVLKDIHDKCFILLLSMLNKI